MCIIILCIFCYIENWTILVFFFFFSSRRRHTRSGDWSSDVCSSDLGDGVRAQADQRSRRRRLSDGDRGGRAARVAHCYAAQHVGHGRLAGAIAAGVRDRRTIRSEERRVGKEGRCRWRTEREENEERA